MPGKVLGRAQGGIQFLPLAKLSLQSWVGPASSPGCTLEPPGEILGQTLAPTHPSEVLA